MSVATPATVEATGWSIEADPALVVLREPSGALALLDDRGEPLGRLHGEAAAALARRLAGDLAPDPLLDRVLALAPGLARRLAGPARALTPAALVARGRWQQLFVELTAACNERCAHCYAGSGPERREALDRPTAEAVVRDAAALGFETVQLTGGEALLCPFTPDLARLARDLGVPVVEVYTNGLLLTPARYEPLRRAGAAFAFSLYAADPGAHDRVTSVAGSHALTVAAIRRAVAGGSGVRVGVIATRPEDEAHALAAAALARDLGVAPDAVGIDVARAVGRGAFSGRDAPHDPLAAARAHRGGDDPALRPPGGKAAVLPDGRVTPCIFSRAVTLGRVGPAGGLRAALTSPAGRVLQDAVEVAAALRAAGARMTCGECRVTTALLGGGPACGATT